MPIPHLCACIIFSILVILKPINSNHRVLHSGCKVALLARLCCDGGSFLHHGEPSLTHCCVCACFRWFRPWPATGPTPYGSTVSWTLLRCRAVVGNPTPRTKSSKYTPYRLKILRTKISHISPQSPLLEEILSLLHRDVVKPL